MRNTAEMFSFDPNPPTTKKAWSSRSSTCLLYGYSLPPIGVCSIYMHIVVSIVFLTSQQYHVQYGIRICVINIEWASLLFYITLLLSF
jgi:hypothetical protein